MVGGPTATWILAAVMFLAAASGMVAVAMLWETSRERRRRREAVEQLHKVVASTPLESAPGARPMFRGGDSGPDSPLGTLAARLPHFRDIDNLLQQAALPWTAQTYLVRALGFGLAFGLVGLLLTPWYFALVFAAIGGALPYLYVRRRRNKRMNAFEEHLPDAIDLMGRAIRAGHPLSGGFKMAAEEAMEPVAGEFRRVFEEQRFGMPFDDSLLGLADRIPLVDTRILATAVLIQREVGGNLAEILDKIAYVIRERFMIRRQLRTYTAQGRVSGMILALLPLALGCAFFLLNPDYIMTLFTRSIGRLMVAGAIVMQIAGYFWIRKIVNIEI